MKMLLSILILNTTAVLVLNSCAKTSKEYNEFIQKYGSETRVFCKDGFKMRETFLSPTATHPTVHLINSQDCKL